MYANAGSRIEASTHTPWPEHSSPAHGSHGAVLHTGEIAGAGPHGPSARSRPSTDPPLGPHPRDRRHSATRDEDDDDQEDLDGEEDGDAGEEDGVAREARGEETGEEGAGEKGGERWCPARRSGRGACARETRAM